jgi:protein-export membrane protein SecD
MNTTNKAVIAAMLVLCAGLACSMLRPKRPLIWHVTLEVDSSVPDREAATKQTIALIEKRLNLLGVSNFEVKNQGAGRIIINLPDVPDRLRVRNLVSTWGKLEIFALISPPSPAPVQTFSTREEAVASLNNAGAIPSNREIVLYPQIDNDRAAAQKWVVVESPAIVDGSEVRNATAVPDPAERDNYEINFSLRNSGAEKLGAWTGAHINNYLAIVFNDAVISTVYVKSQISDSAQINGHFRKSHAEDFALVLNSGALPAPVHFVEESDN